MQTTTVMETQGDELFMVPTHHAGASLETGGAHWFAQAEGEEDDAEDDKDEITGKVHITVCALSSTP
jgi:hypothetical protein